MIIFGLWAHCGHISDAPRDHRRGALGRVPPGTAEQVSVQVRGDSGGRVTHPLADDRQRNAGIDLEAGRAVPQRVERNPTDICQLDQPVQVVAHELRVDRRAVLANEDVPAVVVVIAPLGALPIGSMSHASRSTRPAFRSTCPSGPARLAHPVRAGPGARRVPVEEIQGGPDRGGVRCLDLGGGVGGGQCPKAAPSPRHAATAPASGSGTARSGFRPLVAFGPQDFPSLQRSTDRTSM